YVGSPRMVEMAIGEKTTLEELGGARMHCTVSGCGDVLATSDEEAIELAKRYLSYMPGSYREPPARAAAAEPKPGRSIDEIVPYDQRKWFDMYEVIDRVIDAGSWFEVKKLFAAEVIVGLARIDGRAVGIVANQPKVKGGVLMVDSSDKAARFIWLCNAFNIPLVYLADVAGFMVGSKVEREGIIRHGAKMVFATSQATVPKISVIVRKCYGAGLYAMCGPAFEPDATLSLPQGQIAIMGPEPAVNAVYYNKIMELPESERAAYVEATSDPVAALALVDSVLAEVPDDPEALRTRGAVLVDVADAERNPACALRFYDEAIALLERGGCPADPDLAAAQRGREAALRQRDSAA